MFPNSKYCEVIKYGKYSMSYHNEQCNRCYRNDVKEYIIFTDIKLCLKCIDSINKTKINPNPIPLVTMQQYIYNNENNYINNDIYINEIIQKFKIIDRVSSKEFKVMINDKIKILHFEEIIKKYWDSLSFCDKEYIINLEDQL
jgi:hypothetical protein